MTLLEKLLSLKADDGTPIFIGSDKFATSQFHVVVRDNQSSEELRQRLQDFGIKSIRYIAMMMEACRDFEEEKETNDTVERVYKMLKEQSQPEEPNHETDKIRYAAKILEFKRK